jgi:hypothetical protein
MRKATLASSRVSVRLSTSNNLSPTEQSFVKFYVGDFYYTVDQIQFWLKSDKNKRDSTKT